MNFRIQTIETGYFALDGGAMFGVVPKTLWERTNPADEKNRILLSLRCLFIELGREKILVDCGIGNKLEPKWMEIYKQDNSQNSMEKSLKGLGIKKEDITKVIITHLHFDHCGGATEKIAGEVVPSFPNASYYIQEEHLLWAQNPSLRDRASFFVENFEPLISSGQLITLKGEGEILPGIELIVFYGHTKAQQLPLIKAGEKKFFYCGDLIPTISHIPIPYCMSYDLEPLKTMQEKEKILKKAVEENWILVFEHDPKIKAGRVEFSEKGFRLNRDSYITRDVPNEEL